MELPIYDYSRSFLQFTTDLTNHTPRMQLEASCRVSDGSGLEAEYFLTSDCMSEHMYRPSGLVAEPPSLFWLIAGRNGEFLMQKRHAAGTLDIKEARRVGERMSSHDGRGRTMLKIDLNARRSEKYRPLAGYADVRRAILGDVPLNGRTTYRSSGGSMTVQLGYPIKTCNIPHDREEWQIDTGPILVPDPAAGDRIDISALQSAFILFNAWDWAELAVRKPVAADGSGAAHGPFFRNCPPGRGEERALCLGLGSGGRRPALPRKPIGRPALPGPAAIGRCSRASRPGFVAGSRGHWDHPA